MERPLDLEPEPRWSEFGTTAEKRLSSSDMSNSGALEQKELQRVKEKPKKLVKLSHSMRIDC